MAEIVLTGITDTLLVELGKRAAAHRRTPADEAKSILADHLVNHRQSGWAEADAIYQRLAAPGRQFCDSAELLREDRDR